MFNLRIVKNSTIEKYQIDIVGLHHKLAEEVKKGKELEEENKRLLKCVHKFTYLSNNPVKYKIGETYEEMVVKDIIVDFPKPSFVGMFKSAMQVATDVMKKKGSWCSIINNAVIKYVAENGKPGIRYLVFNGEYNTTFTEKEFKKRIKKARTKNKNKFDVVNKH